MQIALGLGIPLTPIAAAMSGLGNRPNLDLNFLGGALDPRVTFTRADATSCATFFDSTGRLQTAAANVARFDYDPATPAGTVGGELGGPTLGVAPWATAAGSGTISGGTWAGMSAFALEALTATLTVGKTYRCVGTASVSGGTCGLYGAGGTFYGLITSSFSFTFRAEYTTLSLQANNAGMTIALSSFSLQEVTFTPRGLLIEESRTNLLLHSRDMTQAAWTKTDVTPTRNQVGIDGTANSACLMTEGSAGTASLIQPVSPLVAGSTVTISYALKRGNTDWIQIEATEGAPAAPWTNIARAWFNLSNGTKGSVTAAGATTAQSSTMVSLGGGWYRCTLTALFSGTVTGVLQQLRSSLADGNSGRVSGATYIVDTAQLEVGAFATSVIVTGAATVTRAADSASMTGANFSSWFNATQGTFVAEGSVYGETAATNQTLISVDDSTSSQRMQLRRNTDVDRATFIVVDGGVVQATLESSISTWPVGGSGKLAAAYSINDFAGAFNGVSMSPDTGGTVPVVNRMTIGNGVNTQTFSGWMRRIAFYPTRLPNATLQALTA